MPVNILEIYVLTASNTGKNTFFTVPSIFSTVLFIEFKTVLIEFLIPLNTVLTIVFTMLNTVVNIVFTAFNFPLVPETRNERTADAIVLNPLNTVLTIVRIVLRVFIKMLAKVPIRFCTPFIRP